jgi:hypothetical protein
VSGEVDARTAMLIRPSREQSAGKSDVQDAKAGIPGACCAKYFLGCLKLSFYLSKKLAPTTIRV